jgi:EAL domain-containing protein (putative c-di-GMP-specific phosphodiesterase class I)
LAEGVEDEEEAQACIEMGFQLIQGYLTGKPIPADSL